MGERAHTPGRERPILFSAPMVRALLDGRKTQTRRVLGQFDVFRRDDGTEAPVSCLHIEGEPLPRVTIGNVVTLKKLKAALGDRLWVREAWRVSSDHDGLAPRDIPPGDSVEYAADPEKVVTGKLRPSMFMPRWASRLTLTVTDVRVQRLQEISEEDAEAEGYPSKEQRATSGVAEIRDAYPIAWYSWLWEQINGVGSWEANPWVAAYSFTVERRNIDAPATAAKTGGE